MVNIEKNSEAIVLIHGLKHNSRSMAKFGEFLADYGYRIVYAGYPSTRKPIEELALPCISRALAECDAAEAGKVHFLTHSLGGILVRYYLSVMAIENLGRVVMLAPPNRGSEIVDFFGNWWVFKALYGPAGLQLGTGADSMPNRLGKATFDVGVIAGTRSIDPLLSRLFSEINDGKVAVNKTKLEGMRDFIELPYSHTFIMRREQAIRQALHFIQLGRFSR